jgi:hypothetical protein
VVVQGKHSGEVYHRSQVNLIVETTQVSEELMQPSDRPRIVVLRAIRERLF